MDRPEPANEDAGLPVTDPAADNGDSGAVEDSYRLTSEDTRELTAMLMTVSALILLGAAAYLLAVARSAPSTAEAAGETVFLAVLLLGLDLIVITSVRLTAGRVEVNGAGLVSFNFDGVYVAERTDIARIELRSRSYGRSVQMVWVPLVRLTDGSAFWLDSLGGGREDQPPKPEQLAVIEQIRRGLRLEGDLVRSITDPFPPGQARFVRPTAWRDKGRVSRLVPIALVAKTVVLAALMAALLPTGKGHHTLVAVVGAVGYLTVGLLVDRHMTRRRARPPRARKGKA